MKVIKKILIGTQQDFYRQHLLIINSVLPVKFTAKEVEVLSSFMNLPEVLTAGDTFNTTARKKVMEDLKLSPGGLGNYLKSMIKKEFLIKHPITSRITINKLLLPESQQGYQFKLIKK